MRSAPFDLIQKWIPIFCPAKGPMRFQGRHIDQRGVEGDAQWAKGQWFGLLINQWTNPRYLDPPIVPHS
ncbi:uncharacterized protein L199_004492 [Kwoniella botswanensis]|uniref:uncharacterized protein n=1 Tax=Kwoniella botswanensis TaxID=1268659 RepID=UPI00315C9A1B